MPKYVISAKDPRQVIWYYYESPREDGWMIENGETCAFHFTIKEHAEDVLNTMSYIYEQFTDWKIEEV